MQQFLQGIDGIPCAHLIVDEVHNRAISDDVFLAVVKHHVLTQNKQLKVILMSAATDDSKLAQYFCDEYNGTAEIVSIENSPYRVDSAQTAIGSPADIYIVPPNPIIMRGGMSEEHNRISVGSLPVTSAPGIPRRQSPVIPSSEVGSADKQALRHSHASCRGVPSTEAGNMPIPD